MLANQLRTLEIPCLGRLTAKNTANLFVPVEGSRVEYGSQRKIYLI